MDSNVMFVQDENGNELEMTILFTFENNGNNYVVFHHSQDESGEVYASKYSDKKELMPIETDAEWEMVEEVILAFQEDENGED